MGYLVLLRHGQSFWNQQNIFTGWVDIPLNTNGMQEAKRAGEKFSQIPFDTIFVSNLVRAQMTAFIALNESKTGKIACLIHDKDPRHLEMAKVHDPKIEKTLIPVLVRAELNERMYGDLQGMNKEETLKKFGDEQFRLWRRSYRVNPPNGESLEMTAKRALPFFQTHVLPLLSEGKSILVSAHGNSLRAIVMFLDKLSEEEVINLEIPTGDPLCYQFFKNGTWDKVPVEVASSSFKK